MSPKRLLFDHLFSHYLTEEKFFSRVNNALTNENSNKFH